MNGIIYVEQFLEHDKYNNNDDDDVTSLDILLIHFSYYNSKKGHKHEITKIL